MKNLVIAIACLAATGWLWIHESGKVNANVAAGGVETEVVTVTNIVEVPVIVYQTNTTVETLYVTVTNYEFVVQFVVVTNYMEQVVAVAAADGGSDRVAQSVPVQKKPSELKGLAGPKPYSRGVINEHNRRRPVNKD